MKPLFTLMLLLVLTGTAYCQPGSLDSSFSHDGKQTALSSYERGVGVAIDTRERVVVAGDNSIGSFTACRFNPNGSLDNSFGDNGIAAVKIFYQDDYSLASYAMAVQRDNKVLIVGDNSNGIFSHGYIARINANGTPDSSFGYHDAYTFAGSRPRSVAVQLDGKIVIAGYAAYTNNSDNNREKFEVDRLNANGTNDTAFGIGGEAAFTFSKGTNLTFDMAYSVAIQPDGKIVVAGVSNGDSQRFALARLLSNGTLDKTFGKEGEVLTQAVNYSHREEASAVTFQNDGKILVAGTYSNTDNLKRGIVIRYLANGSVDTTYGDHGKVLLRFPRASSSQYVTSIAVQPNGKAIVGGYITTDHAEFALASINTDGTLDADFGSGGIATAKVGESSMAYGVAVQSDGKIVEGGYAGSNGVVQFAAARFTGEGAAATKTNETPIGEIITKSVKPARSNRIAGRQPLAALTVYPNPVINAVTAAFAATGKYILQLSDVSGKILMLKTGVANKGITSVSLNLSRYAAGRYVLVLTDEQHRQTFVLSKQ